jgi:hypothetical protein
MSNVGYLPGGGDVPSKESAQIAHNCVAEQRVGVDLTRVQPSIEPCLNNETWRLARPQPRAFLIRPLASPRPFQVLDGIDPVDWIVSKNVNRRHQSKGAIAITVAKIFLDPEKQGRGRKGLISKSFPMVEFVGWWDNEITSKHSNRKARASAQNCAQREEMSNDINDDNNQSARNCALPLIDAIPSSQKTLSEVG